MALVKRMVGEVTGLTDIGKIVSKEEYGLVQADDYIFHEDDEIIHYVIKSLKDEYCFTNLGIIHVDGQSAVSTRRLVKRYTFLECSIEQVFIESAGNMDRDCEIKFTLKNANAQVIHFNLAVQKDQIEQLKDLYKALSSIGYTQKEATRVLNSRYTAVTDMIELFRNNRGVEVTAESLESIMNLFLTKRLAAYAEYKSIDYGSIFTKYINN